MQQLWRDAFAPYGLPQLRTLPGQGNPRPGQRNQEKVINLKRKNGLNKVRFFVNPPDTHNLWVFFIFLREVLPPGAHRLRMTHNVPAGGPE